MFLLKLTLFILIPFFLTGCGHNMFYDSETIGLDISIPIGQTRFGITIGSTKQVTAGIRGGSYFKTDSDSDGTWITGPTTRSIRYGAGLQVNEGNIKDILEDPDVGLDVKLALIKILQPSKHITNSDKLIPVIPDDEDNESNDPVDPSQPEEPTEPPPTQQVDKGNNDTSVPSTLVSPPAKQESSSAGTNNRVTIVLLLAIAWCVLVILIYIRTRTPKITGKKFSKNTTNLDDLGPVDNGDDILVNPEDDFVVSPNPSAPKEEEVKKKMRLVSIIRRVKAYLKYFPTVFAFIKKLPCKKIAKYFKNFLSKFTNRRSKQ